MNQAHPSFQNAPIFGGPQSTAPINFGNPKFTEIMRRNVIYDALFGFLSETSLVRLGAVSRQAQAALFNYRRRAFNATRHLSRFFNDATGFRSLQARTGTIVSGSCTLQFMDRTVYAGTDLDLFIQPYA